MTQRLAELLLIGLLIGAIAIVVQAVREPTSTTLDIPVGYPVRVQDQTGNGNTLNANVTNLTSSCMPRFRIYVPAQGGYQSPAPDHLTIINGSDHPMQVEVCQ